MGYVIAKMQEIKYIDIQQIIKIKRFQRGIQSRNLKPFTNEGSIVNKRQLDDEHIIQCRKQLDPCSLMELWSQIISLNYLNLALFIDQRRFLVKIHDCLDRFFITAGLFLVYCYFRQGTQFFEGKD
ncbi:unnamed protein product [Paramecium primaurelia]|uniref:Uncharacterized protein n=1 Tax=Paramecium primaurelia TaxID=5886 RepID=A0A8S1QQR3_PARPR|nr:unnamed protein product [Paramecium primaurelia]